MVQALRGWSGGDGLRGPFPAPCPGLSAAQEARPGRFRVAPPPPLGALGPLPAAEGQSGRPVSRRSRGWRRWRRWPRRCGARGACWCCCWCRWPCCPCSSPCRPRYGGPGPRPSPLEPASHWEHRLRGSLLASPALPTSRGILDFELSPLAWCYRGISLHSLLKDNCVTCRQSLNLSELWLAYTCLKSGDVLTQRQRI